MRRQGVTRLESIVKSTEPASAREAVLLEPGQGRAYPMGRIGAVFKADGAETQNRYAISEWWLAPHTQGPGPTPIPKTTSST
jgi:hypothetical protein